ncbi:fimbrial protein [Burkholderia sp. Bp9031]|uniref:fimbrial protein n=1 Tax=Burkholderia sp. Bp9031 TaxID=2184566 RepID=UPI0021AB822C|nr:fimbrial protein [Burkholderia sp. Bp9031]
MAHTAQADPVSKKITLTAQINDGIFVSEPDGSTWYGTEELQATDYTQRKFEKSLPVRIWSTSADVNVSLAQSLKLTSGRYEMANPMVSLSPNGGGQGNQVRRRRKDHASDDWPRRQISFAD